MTFLANENFPRASIRYLKEIGFEVISASEKFHMASDHRIVEIAKAEGLVILTMDKDYGKIIFKDGVVDPPPIVLFRFPTGTPPDLPAKILELHLKQGRTIAGKFTVIDEDDWRQRPLPP